MESPHSDDHDAQPVNPVKLEEVGYAIRAARADDIGFIVDSWRRSYQYDRWTSCPEGLPEYFDTETQVIHTCLQTGEAFVAHPHDDDAKIWGWCCVRKPAVVHYVFVSPLGGRRRQGIACELLQEALPGLKPPGRVFITHGIQRPIGKPRGSRRTFDETAFAGLRGLVAKAWRLGLELEYNPALIFGRKV